MLHTVIFIGRSGCGKGTQAALLKERILKHDLEKRPLLYVETGEKFRQFIRGKDYSSQISKEVYDSDDRQPDFLAVVMWGGMLLEELDHNMHLMFDGAPRSAAEARMLTTALEFYSREKPTVIHLNVSRRWSEDRLLSRARIDDRGLSKINKRLDWFEKDSQPAIEYFKTNSLYRVLEINGEQPIEKVHRDIVAAYEYEK